MKTNIARRSDMGLTFTFVDVPVPNATCTNYNKVPLAIYLLQSRFGLGCEDLWDMMYFALGFSRQ